MQRVVCRDARKSNDEMGALSGDLKILKDEEISARLFKFGRAVDGSERVYSLYREAGQDGGELQG